MPLKQRNYGLPREKSYDLSISNATLIFKCLGVCVFEGTTCPCLSVFSSFSPILGTKREGTSLLPTFDFLKVPEFSSFLLLKPSYVRHNLRFSMTDVFTLHSRMDITVWLPKLRRPVHPGWGPLAFCKKHPSGWGFQPGWIVFFCTLGFEMFWVLHNSPLGASPGISVVFFVWLCVFHGFFFEVVKWTSCIGDWSCVTRKRLYQSNNGKLIKNHDWSLTTIATTTCHKNYVKT